MTPPTRTQEIAERYAAVQAEVAAAARAAGRDPAEVTVVAVTKTWPAEVVVAAYEAGIRHVGENRPEELAEKRAAVEAQLGPDSGLVWHLIGPLQSRKTALAAEHADLFHALDRIKIARRLSRELRSEAARCPSSCRSTPAAKRRNTALTPPAGRKTRRSKRRCWRRRARSPGCRAWSCAA